MVLLVKDDNIDPMEWGWEKDNMTICTHDGQRSSPEIPPKGDTLQLISRVKTPSQNCFVVSLGVNSMHVPAIWESTTEEGTMLSMDTSAP